MKSKPEVTLRLRNATPRDVPAFYRMHADPEANRRGSLIPRKKAAFFAHWKKVLKNRLNVKQTIVYKGRVAGYLVSFTRTGTGKKPLREVGYWIARKYWGLGLATEGLRQLLQERKKRPLYARVAKKNPGSLRVAQKCGFKIVKEDEYQNEAGVRVEEYLLKLSRRAEARKKK